MSGDPRAQELLQLADFAFRGQLRDDQRPRWRELVDWLLGHIRSGTGGYSALRQHLRAPAELDVDILAPDEMASIATSSIGSGGLALRIAEVIPEGTAMDISIKVPQRKVPLLVKAQVAWSRQGELGAEFVDLAEADRELLEAIAVQQLVR
jgi:hypothetical protein